jgi:hypothetical protein
MLGVELFQWSVDSSNLVVKKSALMLAVTCESTSWDLSCIHWLIGLSDRDFQNIFFILLAKHNAHNFTACWSNFLLSYCMWFHLCHDFGNGITFFLSFVRNNCDFGSLCSLTCMISYKPFKIFSCLLA